MQRSGEIRDSATQPNGIKPLPLFRPEALAAQQHKFYGQIVLIRPFSLLFLGWLGFAIAASAMAFIFLGHYTEKARVPGILLAGRHSATSAATLPSTADFYVPSRWMAKLHPGDMISLRCQTCSFEFREQSATVQQISNAPLSPMEVAALANVSVTEPAYKITVSLTPPAAQIPQSQTSQMQVSQTKGPPQTGIPVEAEIPLGSKPFIQWLFERSGT